jgi:hypothetical protein
MNFEIIHERGTQGNRPKEIYLFIVRRQSRKEGKEEKKLISC